MKDGISRTIVPRIHVGTSRYDEIQPLWEDASRSKDLFDSFDDIDRSFLVEVVSKSLHYMADRTDFWLEHSLAVHDSGDEITVKIDILVSDMENNRDAVQYYEKKEGNQLSNEVMKLGEDLGS